MATEPVAVISLRSFLLSSGSLILSQVLTAGVGFVFWLVASRIFSQADVGFAAGVTSGISLVGAVGAVGLGTLLVYEIPRRPGQEMAMIATSLAASGGIGGVLGLGFALIAPSLSADFGPLTQSIGLPALVAIGAAMTSASLVIDQALIGLLRSDLQLVRNVLAAVIRLGLLVAFAFATAVSAATALIAPWVVSLAVSMVVLGLYSAKRGSLRKAYPFQWGFLGQQWLPALQHHLLNLAIQIPGWAMPIVAVIALSASANGGFFLAWQLLGIAAFVQVALISILYAAASRERESLAHWGRITFGLSLATAAVSAAGLWLVGPLVLGIFGRGYASAGAEALVALPLTLLGAAVKGHYVTVHRVRGTVPTAARLVTVAAILEILGGFVGASLDGLRGLGVGVVAAMALEVLPMLPVIDSAILRPPNRPTDRSHDGRGPQDGDASGVEPSNAPRSGAEP